MAVYFLTPDYKFPSGGVRVIYQHVDVLNKNGIRSFVLHRTPGHRCTWFENSTAVAHIDESFLTRVVSKAKKIISPNTMREIRIIGGAERTFQDSDYIVFPEIYGPEILKTAPGIQKVILNQNCYLSFQGFPLDDTPISTPYTSPDIRGVLINSEDGLQYLNFAFPELKTQRFHLSIDTSIFSYSPDKKLKICYTARKNELVVRQVISLLKVRGAISEFELVPFGGQPQAEVAALMKESAIFLSFGQYEGFGLPPAEAMSCGCIAIGYHAGGGREFMKPEFSFPVTYGEVIGFVETIESVAQDYIKFRDKYSEMGLTASKFITDTYSKDREEKDLLTFWRGLLGGN
jgi:glycosyltransferase involved in cell wall biosynthesis